MIWQITLGGLCFGISGTDRIKQAAPCAKWCIGKPSHQIIDYWKRRGAKVIEL